MSETISSAVTANVIGIVQSPYCTCTDELAAELVKFHKGCNQC